MTPHTDKQPGWPAPRNPADDALRGADAPGEPDDASRRLDDDTGPTGPSSLVLVLVLVGVVILAGGWFALSALVMGTRAGDALGEALGVGFALLIVVSVVGAARSRSGGRRPD
ncbi:MAG TPA: hypothetical protein VF054_03420 [Micromonosporaceae bacterium]